MVQMRQEDASGDRMVARLSRRRLLPHAVATWAGLGLSVAALASFDSGMTALGVVLFGVASVVLVAGLWLMAVKLELIVDHEGIRCPGDRLVVPWADVVSVDLAGRSALRVEVRDGRGLLARQAPDLSMWGPRRRRLADSGVLACPVGGLDRSPTEILNAATRLRALGGGGAPSVREEVAIAEAPESERRDAHRQRLIVAISAALVVLQLVTVACLYLL
jgi:hypothetical protein